MAVTQEVVEKLMSCTEVISHDWTKSIVAHFLNIDSAHVESLCKDRTPVEGNFACLKDYMIRNKFYHTVFPLAAKLWKPHLLLAHAIWSLLSKCLVSHKKKLTF